VFYFELSRRRFCEFDDDDAWRCPLLSFSSLATLERECDRGNGSGDIDRSELIRLTSLFVISNIQWFES